MPIGNRTRSGQALFTQPQMEQRQKFTNQGYYSVLSQKLGSKGPVYTDKEAPKIDALPEAMFDYESNWNALQNAARSSAEGMTRVLKEAGSVANMDESQTAEYASYEQDMQKTVYLKMDLEAKANQAEHDRIEHDAEVKTIMNNGVGLDAHVEKVKTSQSYIPIMLTERDQNTGKFNNRALTEIEYVKGHKTQGGININNTGTAFDYQAYDPSGNYDYTGAFNDESAKWLAQAKSSYRTQEGKLRLEAVIDSGEFGAIANDPVALAAIYNSATQKNNMTAVTEVKHRMWDIISGNENMMIDISKQFAKTISQNPLNAYADTRVATEDDKLAGRQTFYQIKTTTKNPAEFAKMSTDEKTGYSQVKGNWIKREREEHVVSNSGDETIIGMVVQGRAGELSPLELQKYDQMVEYYAFKKIESLEKMYASDSITYERQKITLGDAGDAGQDLFKKTKMSQKEMLTNPAAVQSYADNGGYSEQTPIQQHNADGSITQHVDYKTPVVNWTGDAAHHINIWNKDQALIGLDLFSTNSQNDEDINDIDYNTYKNLAASRGVNINSGTRGLISGQGMIMNYEDQGFDEPLIYSFGSKSYMIGGMKIKGNKLVYADKNDPNRQRIPVIDVYYTMRGDQMSEKNFTVAQINKPKVEKKTISNINIDDYEVVYNDYVAYDSYAEFQKAQQLSNSETPMANKREDGTMEYRMPTNEEWDTFSNPAVPETYYEYEEDLALELATASEWNKEPIVYGSANFKSNPEHANKMDALFQQKINAAKADNDTEALKEAQENYTYFMRRYRPGKITNHVYLRHKKDGYTIQANKLQNAGLGQSFDVEVVTWEPYNLKWDEVEDSDQLMKELGIEAVGEIDEEGLIDDVIYKFKGKMPMPIQGIGDPKAAGSTYMYELFLGSLAANKAVRQAEAASKDVTNYEMGE